MVETNTSYLQGQVLDEDVLLTVSELCRACGVAEEHVTTWVFEGVLEPTGQQQQDWRFGGQALHRAQRALRLTQDFEINAAGVALVLDLLDQLDAMRAQLRRSGSGNH